MIALAVEGMRGFVPRDHDQSIEEHIRFSSLSSNQIPQSSHSNQIYVSFFSDFGVICSSCEKTNADEDREEFLVCFPVN